MLSPRRFLIEYEGLEIPSLRREMDCFHSPHEERCWYRPGTSLVLHKIQKAIAIRDVHARLAHIEDGQGNRGAPRFRGGAPDSIGEEFVHNRGYGLAAIRRNPLDLGQTPFV